MGLISKDRIRAKLRADDTNVRLLLAHPMHTGRAQDAGEQAMYKERINERLVLYFFFLISCYMAPRNQLNILW